jgi:ATP-dependent RNA helicase DeaD
MTSRFNNRGFSVVALSGELSQTQRTQALQSIRDGRARVCIATDVAARGLDLPNLELVIHADLPKNRESLLHRSGRTGRAGRKGSSVLIVPNNARKRTERLFQSAKIDTTWANPPTVHEISKRDDERILLDPILTSPLTDAEHSFAEHLIKSHSAEQIAGAFVRIYRAGQSAPEEISAIQSDDFDLRDRDDYRNKARSGAKVSSNRRSRDISSRQNMRDKFEKGVWFSLSVGKKHTAEARWLLPAIIRAGNLQKKDVGAIRIQESHTYFEIATESADKFMEALGPNRKLEKSMSVEHLGGMPKVLTQSDELESGLEQSPGKRKKPRLNNKNYKSKTPIEKRIYGEKPGQIEADEKALRHLMENAEKANHTDPKQDLRSHSKHLAKGKPEGAKQKKSKKEYKIKEKKRQNTNKFVRMEEIEIQKKDPKLKFSETSRKKRARVKRNSGGSDLSGEHPLKRNRANNIE